MLQSITSTFRLSHHHELKVHEMYRMMEEGQEFTSPVNKGYIHNSVAIQMATRDAYFPTSDLRELVKWTDISKAPEDDPDLYWRLEEHVNKLSVDGIYISSQI